MSIEGSGRYSSEEIAKFERSRIQDPEQAQEMANMLASALEGKENVTARDYDEALNQLEILQRTIDEEPVPESIDKALRTFAAGTALVTQRVPRLLVAAALHIIPYPRNVKDRIRQEVGGGVIGQLQGVGNEYKEIRRLFQTAREELESWKAEAEEFGRKHGEGS